MSRAAFIAILITFCVSLAAQAETKSKNALPPQTDAANDSTNVTASARDDFPKIADDQTRGPNFHRAHVLCDDSCTGPNMACFESECMATFKHFWCATAL